MWPNAFLSCCGRVVESYSIFFPFPKKPYKVEVVRDWKLSKRKSSREHVLFVYSVNTSQEIIDNKVACYARYAQGFGLYFKRFQESRLSDYQTCITCQVCRKACRSLVTF